MSQTPFRSEIYSKTLLLLELRGHPEPLEANTLIRERVDVEMSFLFGGYHITPPPTDALDLCIDAGDAVYFARGWLIGYANENTGNILPVFGCSEDEFVQALDRAILREQEAL